MLILFDSKQTKFDSLGLGILKDCKSNPIITENLNAEYTLEFDYALNGYLSNSIDVNSIIKVKGISHPTYNNQLFVVSNIKKSNKNNKITVFCKHIAIAVMSNLFLEDVAPTNLNATSALDWILNRTSTSNDFTVNGDCEGSYSARYVRKSLIDAIYNEDNAILKRFGGELRFDNLNIHLNNKRGSSAKYNLYERKNLSGVEYNIDFSKVVTRLLPEGNDALLLDEKYVDSSRINDYPHIITKKQEFNIGVDEESGITEEQAKKNLKDACDELFANGLDLPTVSIKVDFVELSKTIEYKQYSFLETCYLGDTVAVKTSYLNLDLESRIVKIEYDCALDKYSKLELGTVTPSITKSQSDTTKEVLNKIEESNPTTILEKSRKYTNELLKQPFKGYIYFNDANGEMYLMDSPNVETAQKVWKFGVGGIGFSSTGIDGEYIIGLTQSGQINANLITTGTLNADLLKAGTISSINGDTYWNLDTGEFYSNKISFLESEQTTLSGTINNTSNGLEVTYKKVANQTKKIDDQKDEIAELQELYSKLKTSYDKLHFQVTNLANLNGVFVNTEDIQQYEGEYVPALSNAPANEWFTYLTPSNTLYCNTNVYVGYNTYQNFVGKIFKDTVYNDYYMWMQVNGKYDWVKMTYNEIIKKSNMYNGVLLNDDSVEIVSSLNSKKSSIKVTPDGIVPTNNKLFCC